MSLVLKSQKPAWPRGGQEERAQPGFYQSVEHNSLLGDSETFVIKVIYPLGLKSGCFCRSVVLAATVTESSAVTRSLFPVWGCVVSSEGHGVLTQ